MLTLKINKNMKWQIEKIQDYTVQCYGVGNTKAHVRGIMGRRGAAATLSHDANVQGRKSVALLLLHHNVNTIKCITPFYSCLSAPPKLEQRLHGSYNSLLISKRLQVTNYGRHHPKVFNHYLGSTHDIQLRVQSKKFHLHLDA